MSVSSRDGAGQSSVQRTLRRAVSRFSRTRFFRRVGPAIMPPLERVTSALTRGKHPLSGFIVPSLVLHSTGAKSGLERDTELMYVPEGDGMLVTGSNFARDRHPAWTVNLLKHPAATVSVDRRLIPVRAELIGDDEREAIWTFIENQWPGYRGYERASGRELRIFRLVPRPEQPIVLD